jgi:aminoglycoside phosphotransferase (APT) family kinase protein
MLTALHAFPTARALEVGAVDLSGEHTRAYYLDARRREFGERVLPLLSPAERNETDRQFRAFDRESAGFSATVAHRDLGPAHVLVEDGRVSGVIDWADAAVADPAIDFAWLLHGVDEEFAGAVLDAYGGDVDDSLLARARFYHVLGPFYEVVYGQLTDQPEFVTSGLEGVRRRLERWPPSA